MKKRKNFLSVSGKLVFNFAPLVCDLQLQAMSLDSVLFITSLFHCFFLLSYNLLPFPAVLEGKLSVLLPICLYITSIWLCYFPSIAFATWGLKKRKNCLLDDISKNNLAKSPCVVFWSSSTISRWYNNTNGFSDVMCPTAAILKTMLSSLNMSLP